MVEDTRAGMPRLFAFSIEFEIGYLRFASGSTGENSARHFSVQTVAKCVRIRMQDEDQGFQPCWVW